MDPAKPNDPQFMSFQDFPDPMVHGDQKAGQASAGLSGVGQPNNFSNRSNDTIGINMMEDLQGLPDKSEAPASPSFWTLEYYQKFFNVNTNDVLERIIKSMLPHGTENYLVTRIRQNPDLYGPFWICVTLVFSIAISGNMANYLQTASSGKYHWRYDFHVVSYAATCIFLYAWILPIGLWAALKWTGNSGNQEEELIEFATPGLLELVCLYGYSLAIYIPVAFLWTIQINWLQWGLVLYASLLSGGVLIRSLMPVITGKHKIIYAAVILGLHLALAVGFMEYFFHTSIPISAADVTSAITEAIVSPTSRGISNFQPSKVKDRNISDPLPTADLISVSLPSR